MNYVVWITVFLFEMLSEQPTRRVVVSIRDRKLMLLERGALVKSYPVAVGRRSSPTPTGAFKIVVRIPEPTWYGPKQVVPPGKSNPLGTRWIGLNQKGYGIHGTNAPRSIGRNASHGCIRMRTRDVEELFNLVQVGDAVELMEELTPELARLFAPPQQSEIVTGGGL
jgi:lipoprotein-anchoring transpeptidase ErfK/SrfK